ncbi:MAG: hypothetical protein ACKOAD_04540, partial [Gammaproteobacteria bacterium]
ASEYIGKMLEVIGRINNAESFKKDVENLNREVQRKQDFVHNKDAVKNAMKYILDLNIDKISKKQRGILNNYIAVLLKPSIYGGLDLDSTHQILKETMDSKDSAEDYKKKFMLLNKILDMKASVPEDLKPVEKQTALFSRNADLWIMQTIQGGLEFYKDSLVKELNLKIKDHSSLIKNDLEKIKQEFTGNEEALKDIERISEKIQGIYEKINDHRSAGLIQSVDQLLLIQKQIMDRLSKLDAEFGSNVHLKSIIERLNQNCDSEIQSNTLLFKVDSKLAPLRDFVFEGLMKALEEKPEDENLIKSINELINKNKSDLSDVNDSVKSNYEEYKKQTKEFEAKNKEAENEIVRLCSELESKQKEIESSQSKIDRHKAVEHVLKESMEILKIKKEIKESKVENIRRERVKKQSKRKGLGGAISELIEKAGKEKEKDLEQVLSKIFGKNWVKELENLNKGGSLSATEIDSKITELSSFMEIQNNIISPIKDTLNAANEKVNKIKESIKNLENDIKENNTDREDELANHMKLLELVSENLYKPQIKKMEEALKILYNNTVDQINKILKEIDLDENSINDIRKMITDGKVPKPDSFYLEIIKTLESKVKEMELALDKIYKAISIADRLKSVISPPEEVKGLQDGIKLNKLTLEKLKVEKSKIDKILKEPEFKQLENIFEIRGAIEQFRHYVQNDEENMSVPVQSQAVLNANTGQLNPMSDSVLSAADAASNSAQPATAVAKDGRNTAFVVGYNKHTADSPTQKDPAIGPDTDPKPKKRIE